MKLLLRAALALAVSVGIAGVLAIGFVPSYSQDEDDTQAVMRGVFVTVTKAYRYSLDPEGFEDPGNRTEIMHALQALSDNADNLEAHTSHLDPSFDYLKRSLARDAHEALARFQAKQYTGSRWVLAKLTENCVTCHSKQPSATTFDPGSDFIDESEVKTMAPAARVELEIATRQFDRAMSTYERMFADPNVSAQTLMLIGAFESYLRLSVVVREDTPRAMKTLGRYVAREDVPPHMKELAGAWLVDLNALDVGSARGRELDAARDMIQAAQRRSRFPSDRTSLVEFITSTTLLHTYLAARPDDKELLAEAYYLLAIAESYVTRSYWISEADYLLEQAIRTAPKSPIASDAFAFLVAYTAQGHTTMARDLPQDVTKNLDELRQLMEE